MDDLGARIRERVEAREEDTGLPERIYGFYRDSVPAPAMYVETEAPRVGIVPVIVHNFRYYEAAMRRWNAGVVETLVLNELHELTHWAMTEEERAALDRRSVARGVPDGQFINPRLFGLIEWLGAEYTRVYDPGPPRWRRVLREAARYLRDVVGREDGAIGDGSVDDGESAPGDTGDDF